MAIYDPNFEFNAPKVQHWSRPTFYASFFVFPSFQNFFYLAISVCSFMILQILQKMTRQTNGSIVYQ